MEEGREAAAATMDCLRVTWAGRGVGRWKEGGRGGDGREVLGEREGDE
jgi:hypothetical protein